MSCNEYSIYAEPFYEGKVEVTKNEDWQLPNVPREIIGKGRKHQRGVIKIRSRQSKL